MILLIYLYFLGIVLVGLLKSKKRKVAHSKVEMISVIVSLKNELNHVNDLISSVRAQTYPDFEIIIIDDHSTDGTWLKLQEYNNWDRLHLLKNEGSGKNSAIQLGVRKAKGTHIVFTDGDCIVGKDWLKHFADAFRTTDFVLAPVFIQSPNSLIEKLQNIDFLALMGVAFGMNGIGSPINNNGANYGIKRYLYQSSLKSSEISSGDDMFQLAYALKNNVSITSVTDPEIQVETKAVSGWKALLNQRARWMSKNQHLSWRIWLVQTIIFFTNIFVIYYLIRDLELGLTFLFVKFLMDYLFLSFVRVKFKRKVNLSSLLILEIIYPFYLLFLSIRSFFPIYWKGDEIKKGVKLISK